jgi:ABC-type transport system involved in multi-copper enzyme maturation permease subunit
MMRLFAITLKDLKHSFRSAFGLMFMFGIPLLLTGVFAFAFNGSSEGNSENSVQKPVLVAFVDEDKSAESRQLIGLLSAEDMQAYLHIVEIQTMDAAKEKLNNDVCDLVMQIPLGFSNVQNESYPIALYAKIAGDSNVATVKNLVLSMVNTMQIQNQMAKQIQIGNFPVEKIDSLFAEPTISLIAKPTDKSVSENIISGIVSNIMGAMMIFFAFFSGAFGAQSILTEEAHGTLQRLFTTGNSRQQILAGKFLAVWIMLVVQIASLLFVSGWLFDIDWGNPLGQLMLAVGIGTAAAGFGILLLSFLRDMRSAGLVFSGAVMVTGFVGLGAVFTGSGEIGTQALFVPQGWAIKGLWALQSGDQQTWWMAALVLLGWGLVLFMIGKLRFDRRYKREI